MRCLKPYRNQRVASNDRHHSHFPSDGYSKVIPRSLAKILLNLANHNVRGMSPIRLCPVIPSMLPRPGDTAKVLRRGSSAAWRQESRITRAAGGKIPLSIEKSWAVKHVVNSASADRFRLLTVQNGLLNSQCLHRICFLLRKARLAQLANMVDLFEHMYQLRTLDVASNWRSSKPSAQID